jgi:carbonic anhydrase/acetyltransferase-like protein (isoleucine patch superfamily)
MTTQTADVHVTTLLQMPLRAASHLVWIPSALLLLVLFALAVAPPFALLSLTLAQVPPETPVLLRGMAWGLAAAFGYGLYCLTFPALVVASRLVLRSKDTPQRLALTSPKMLTWYHSLLSTYAVHKTAGPLLRALGLYRWFAIGMGMKLGAGSVLNTTNIYDHDLISIGDNVVIGGDAVLTGHIVEGRELIRKRITIHDGAVIGLHAVLLPGCTVGAGCHVGALSLVPKDAVLESGQSYGGVSVRPLMSAPTSAAEAKGNPTTTPLP